ncbi:MAG: serine kinase [Pseudomonadota bacterium]
MSGETLHASCVAFDSRAVLILGASGAGKSSLILSLIALGGTLVADDRVELTVEEKGLVARAPAPLAGRVEARGVGILSSIPCADGVLHCVASLDQAPDARMPEPRWWTHLGHTLPLISGQNVPDLAPVLAILLRNATLPDSFTSER